MPPTVLICPKVLDHTPGQHFDTLVGAGFSVKYAKPMKDLLSADELAANLTNVDAVIAGSEPYTADILERFPNLRVISRVGVGYDSVDVAAATARGMAVTITPGTNHDSVAEHTLALILAVAKRIVPNHLGVAAGGFDRRMTRPLRGQTLGLIGFGRIGKAVGATALTLGMRVMVHDPFVNEAGSVEYELVSLDDLLRKSDLVSLHAPMTPDTKHLINRASIAKMQHGAVLINTARGSLVDEEAAAEALTVGRLGALATDVFETEPPEASPLLSAPNVLFTPHIAGIDEEGVRQMSVMACQTVVDLFKGRWPAERIVNAKDLTDWAWARPTAATS